MENPHPDVLELQFIICPCMNNQWSADSEIILSCHFEKMHFFGNLFSKPEDRQDRLFSIGVGWNHDLSNLEFVLCVVV